jgi:hypothetical protein
LGINDFFDYAEMRVEQRLHYVSLDPPCGEQQQDGGNSEPLAYSQPELCVWTERTVCGLAGCGFAGMDCSL